MVLDNKNLPCAILNEGKISLEEVESLLLDASLGSTNAFINTLFEYVDPELIFDGNSIRPYMLMVNSYSIAWYLFSAMVVGGGTTETIKELYDGILEKLLEVRNVEGDILWYPGDIALFQSAISRYLSAINEYAKDVQEGFFTVGVGVDFVNDVLDTYEKPREMIDDLDKFAIGQILNSIEKTSFDVLQERCLTFINQ